MKLKKGLFPAVTAKRLFFVSLMVSLLSPILWGLAWVPFSRSIALNGFAWEYLPLILFPAGVAAMTYFMHRAGWMKSENGDQVSYPLRPDLSNKQYNEGIDSGAIQPLKKK